MLSSPVVFVQIDVQRKKQINKFIYLSIYLFLKLIYIHIYLYMCVCQRNAVCVALFALRLVLLNGNTSNNEASSICQSVNPFSHLPYLFPFLFLLPFSLNLRMPPTCLLPDQIKHLPCIDLSIYPPVNLSIHASSHSCTN